MDIGVTKPPIIPLRTGVCDNLETFAVVWSSMMLVMKSKTSCALDPIPTKLVKEYIEEFVPLLAHFINCSIAAGELPHEWKTALVVPLLKKAGLDPIPKNYRPVSNLQYISKLTERAVVDQLWFHL